MQYPAAKVVIKRPNDNNHVLLVSRTFDGQVGFEPAGGRIEVNVKTKTAETFEECAIREIKEELGLDIKLINYVGNYYFFWDIQANTSSHCILFLGEIVSGTLTSFSDDCGELKPEWVSVKDIQARNIPIRNAHVGLENLLVKSANMLQSCQFENAYI